MFSKSKSNTRESPSRPSIMVACPHVGYLRTNVVAALLRITQDTRYNLVYRFSQARPIDSNRNKIVRSYLESDCDFLLMLDEDVVPEGNPLDLIELDLDVVTLLYPIWKHRGAKVLWCVIDKPGGEVRETDLGMIAEVKTCGAGALLIARRVLEHPGLRVPFKIQYDEDGIVNRSEDFAFCDQVWSAGFQVWAALDYKCSHEKTVDLRVVGGMQPASPLVQSGLEVVNG